MRLSRDLRRCPADGAGRRLLAQSAGLPDAAPGHRHPRRPAAPNPGRHRLADRRALADAPADHHALPALPGGPRRDPGPLADAGAGPATLPDDGRDPRRRRQRPEDHHPAP
ncbi:MAG: hypothetical protein WCF99_00180 [Chloroflexales bacterium]